MKKLILVMIGLSLGGGAINATASQSNASIPPISKQQQHEMFMEKKARHEQARKEHDTEKRERAASLIMEKAAERR